jgi:hypothetical protein
MPSRASAAKASKKSRAARSLIDGNTEALKQPACPKDDALRARLIGRLDMV